MREGNLLVHTRAYLLSKGSRNIMKQKRKYMQPGQTQCLYAKGCKGVKMSNVSNRASTVLKQQFLEEGQK